MGRHVVITGGGRGIGAEIARRFAAEGDRVTVLARTRDEVEKVADEIGGFGVRCDVGEPASVEAAFMAAGPVDVLINNAGMQRRAPFQDFAAADWDDLTPGAIAAFECAFLPFAARLTKNELYAMGKEWRIPIAPMSTPTDLLESRQLQYRGFFVDIPSGRATSGITMPGAPYKFSKTPWRQGSPAPVMNAAPHHAESES